MSGAKRKRHSISSYRVFVVEVRMLCSTGFEKLFVTNYIAPTAEAAEAMAVTNAKGLRRADKTIIMAKAKKSKGVCNDRGSSSQRNA